jgi:hypothetical protein
VVNLKRLLSLSAILILFLASFSPAFANTGAVDFTTAFNYTNTFYSTTIGWDGHIYGDSIVFPVGSDTHILFNQFSLTSSANPSWTFGVASQNGNANISKIQTNYIRFIGATQPGKVLNLTFYYSSLPVEVDIAEPSNTTILAAAYFTNYAAWVAAPSPAVYKDPTNTFLMVKSANLTPTIQFDLSGSSTTTSTSATTTVAVTCSNITPSAFIDEGSLLIVMALMLIINVFGYLLTDRYPKGTFHLMAGVLGLYTLGSIFQSQGVVIDGACRDPNLMAVLIVLLTIISFILLIYQRNQRV